MTEPSTQDPVERASGSNEPHSDDPTTGTAGGEALAGVQTDEDVPAAATDAGTPAASDVTSTAEGDGSGI